MTFHWRVDIVAGSLVLVVWMNSQMHLVVVWFMSGAGVDSNSGSFITSETSGVKLRHRKAMTVKNLAAYFFNSGDPDAVTVHSRKNRTNGNLTCSIASEARIHQILTVLLLGMIMISVSQDKAMVALVQVI
jgi:hypothetical protein